MTFKDVFFLVDPDQSSVRDGIEKAYTKTYDTLRDTFSKYKELKEDYGRVGVYRIEDEYEECGCGRNVLIKHKQFTLTEA